MNELYNFIINGATDKFEIIVRIVLFLMMFEGIITIIAELMRMGRR